MDWFAFLGRCVAFRQLSVAAQKAPLVEGELAHKIPPRPTRRPGRLPGTTAAPSCSGGGVVLFAADDRPIALALSKSLPPTGSMHAIATTTRFCRLTAPQRRPPACLNRNPSPKATAPSIYSKN